MRNIEQIVEKHKPNYSMSLPRPFAIISIAGGAVGFVALYSGCVFDQSGLVCLGCDAGAPSDAGDAGVYDAGDAQPQPDALVDAQTQLDAIVGDGSVDAQVLPDSGADATVDAGPCTTAPTIASLTATPNPAKTGQNIVTLVLALNNPCADITNYAASDYAHADMSTTQFDQGQVTSTVNYQISLPFGHAGQMWPLGQHDITYVIRDGSNNVLDSMTVAVIHNPGIALGKCVSFQNYAYDGQSLIARCNVLNSTPTTTADYGGQSWPADFDAQMLPANVSVYTINNGAQVEIESNGVIDLPNVQYTDFNGIFRRPLEVAVHLEDPAQNPADVSDGVAYIPTWPNRTLRIFIDNQSGPTCSSRYGSSGAVDFLFGRNGAFPGWQDLVSFPVGFTGNKAIPAGNMAVFVQNIRDLPQGHRDLLNLMYNGLASPQPTYSCIQTALNHQDGMADPIVGARVEIFD
ncbi:TPA: hypothetical protein HA265_03475 [Candidatus Woesearchaeota archaeon]|nr:hypothetical protein [Candidatus Woesearchaeota archaeon]